MDNNIFVEEVAIQLIRKPIRTLRLAIYPDGRVRVSAPLRMSDRTVRRWIESKLDWIRRHKVQVPSAGTLQWVTGEKHSYLGRFYELNVVEQSGRSQVWLTDEGVMELRVAPGATLEMRRRAIEAWYRLQLQLLIPPLLLIWEHRIGVRSTFWGIRKMRSRWGSCNVRAGRIWLSLELAKQPLRCLEYVLVHELVHLLEPSHNSRFWGLVGQFLPDWKPRRDELNRKY
jgi:predicted metal-dependent hydrolase